MIILHAGFSDNQFFLWGETPKSTEVQSSKKTGRKSKSITSRPFPYDTPFERLIGAIQESGIRFTVDKKQLKSITAWLPTVANEPIASSPIIAEKPDSSEKLTLAPYRASSLLLLTGETIDFLCRCFGKQILVPGIIIGNDLSFWVAALRFAGTLIANQHFLPGISEDKGIYRARWQALYIGNANEQLSKLAASMPAIARALTLGSTTPPDKPSITILSDFIGKIVNFLPRQSYYQPSLPEKLPSFDSIHDQWLHALHSPSGNMIGDTRELAQFAEQVHTWQRPLSISTSSPFRLCFRLEEPEESKDIRVKNVHLTSGNSTDWYIRYILQSVHDPSLIIPTKDLWSVKKIDSAIFKNGNFNIQEYMLSSLGQASGLCPHIETSLKTSAPTGYQLDTNSAFEFLTEKAILLEQAGFGVLLPAWWTHKGTKIRLTTKAKVKSPKMQSKGGLSLDEIIQFNWEISLGGEKLSLEELEALAKLKVPLVKIRGQWVHMSSGEIQTAIEYWKNKTQGSTTLGEIIQMALGTSKTQSGVSFEGVSATGWVKNLLKQLQEHNSIELLEKPEKFNGTLRPYQVRGFSWLAFLRKWGLGACLADDMGLGKTIQTLALILQDWESDNKRPVLIICPTSVMGNWQKEAHRFTPELPVMIHHGLTRIKNEEFKTEAMKHAIVVSSYALLHRDLNLLKDVPWSGIILDEAQNIKNPETKQTKAVQLLNTTYRIALTGTPVENNVGDLWSIMNALNPGFLGTQTDFKKKFFIPIQVNRDTGAVELLKRMTKPFILRRLKTDKSIITDLPEKMEMKVFCNLTREQATLYAAVVKEATETIDSSKGIQRKGIVLATLSKLKQVCNHPAQFLGDNSSISDRSGKLIRLTEMADEIVESHERMLIFTQFAEMGKILKRHLQETFGREVFFLYGGVSKKKRDSMVEQFQTDLNAPQIFILSLKAGGTGLNLTKASNVFHFDRWWNPAVENQATDRVFRIGQTKNVQVYKFVCLGTLEEKIDEMIESKKEIAGQVIGAGEGWLTELSTSELKELFSLRETAIGE